MRVMPGIQFRLLLLGFLPTALIGLALAAYFMQARIADLDRNLAMRGELIARELAAAVASAITADDRLVLRDLADTALQEDDVIEVGIFDRQGRALVSRKNPPKEDGEQAEDRLAQIAPVLARHLPDGAQAAVEAGTLGSVRLVLSRSGTCQRQRRETILFGLLILLGGLVVSALLARRMARKISDPVVALTLAVHELSNGNMDARAESKAEAELAYLQAGFNAMAAELKKNRDSLESQVHLATCRLQEALDALEKRNLELESARRLAEVQTELKSRFLAQMSHEIRTPMNGIVGFAELLEKTPLAEEQAEKLGLITRSAKNLLSILNDILDLSKLEAGKISLNLQSFALRPCLEDTVALLSAKAAQPPIVLWVADDVPRAIEGDPVRLQQVVANLLGNALKFTACGKIVIRVRLLAKPGQGRLLFSVSDSGSGIPLQDIAKLFSPFLQLGECATTAEKGAGLGLSIAKNIVESMGGKIHLASRLGKGTSLWFDLPLARAVAQETGTPPVCHARVGLVEADRLFRLALAGQLRSLGVRVEACATEDEFIGRFATADPPPTVLYGFSLRREKANAALPRWLAWCETRQIKLLLLFPCCERRLVGFYRKRGMACLFHPLRSETLAKAIGLVATATGPGQSVPASPAPPPAGAGLRLLVADDNEINRLLLRAQLKGLAADIVEACNGQEALERLRGQCFDLVFLDLQMPLMSGPQVLRELRGHPGPNRHAPVIAITAFAAPGQREAILRDGFADCLIKPILQEQLTGLVNAWLDGGNRPAGQDIEPPPVADSYASAILEKTGGNRELARLIAGKLFAELPQMLRQVAIALGEQDREAAQQAVHKLNGAAGFAGLDGIRHAAASLEAALGEEADGEILEILRQDLAQAIEGFLSQEGAILDQLDRTGESVNEAISKK